MNKEVLGTNKYALLSSQSQDIIDIYSDVFSSVEGSLTTVVDNDVESIINIAVNQLTPSNEQILELNKFRDAFNYIESVIDPEKLNFTITKAVDDEICINHISKNGVSKIIIHEDGMIAQSFVAFNGVDKKDSIEFYEGNIQYQQLAYKFFL
jgi:hypothetical protein